MEYRILHRDRLTSEISFEPYIFMNLDEAKRYAKDNELLVVSFMTLQESNAIIESRRKVLRQFQRQQNQMPSQYVETVLDQRDEEVRPDKSKWDWLPKPNPKIRPTSYTAYNVKPAKVKRL
jgi:hypothetical protein